MITLIEQFEPSNVSVVPTPCIRSTDSKGEMYYGRPTTDKTAKLSWNLPSLGEPSKATAFGKAEPDLGYDYVDRLQLWHDETERETGRRVATEMYGDENTVQWWEAYMSYLYSRPIDIRHIELIRGGNGYTYRAIGYVDLK